MTTYAVMIPFFIQADDPEEAIRILSDELGVALEDGYVTDHDYTIEHMEYAGFEYVEVTS